MDIVVFGAGSLGSLLGGVLASEHEVTLVARGDHADAVRTDGLTIDGKFDRAVSPTVTTDGRNLEADLALLTVKSYDTPEAASVLSTGQFEAVCSLQNGMGNEEQLAATLEAPVLAGTATYGAIRREPGVVECTGRGQLTIGPRDGGRSQRADRIGRALERGGLETTVTEEMPRRLWRKLAVNAAINPITALADVDNGAILEEPAATLARAGTRETACVARACGVSLSDQDALESTDRVARETAANISSMRQDMLAGRRTEIDAINGYVVDRAIEAGVTVATNRTLTALVRSWERRLE